MNGDPSINGNPIAGPPKRDRATIGYLAVSVIGLVLIGLVGSRLVGQSSKSVATPVAAKSGVLLTPVDPSAAPIDSSPADTAPTDTAPAEIVSTVPPSAPLDTAAPETFPVQTFPIETVPNETVPAVTTAPPPTADSNGVRTIPQIKVESAVENGVCKPDATPVPRVTRYQVMNATYETIGHPQSTSTVIHRIDNERGAYEYIDRDAFHRGNDWRHLSYPDAQMGLTFRARTQDDRKPDPMDWGITANELPTDKRNLKEHGVASHLTSAHTKLAPCVYEGTAFHVFADEPPTTVVSYVDADGWMIQQVSTNTSSAGFTSRHTLTFSSPETLTIAEPPCAILSNPAYAKRIKDWCQQISWGCDQPPGLPLTGPEPTATCSIIGSPDSPFQYAPNP
jgi:hypothetical protein